MKLTARLFTLALAIVSAGAAEKNGLMATITKRTIERGDSGSGYYARTDRTQGLALDVKNMSIKEFPEGEVSWTIVVRKSYEGGNEKLSGKEKLKPLKASQQVQLIIGAAQVTGYKTDYRNYKDKVEYDVVITHGGKETIRLTSTPGFEALARRARPARGEGEGEGDRPRRAEGGGEGDAPKKEDGGKTAIIKGGGDKPKPDGGGEKPAPARPDAKPTPKGEGETPAKPDANPPPTGGGEKPAPPKANGDKPAEGGGEKPFDFFNLDKKKKTPPAEQ